MDRLLPSPNWFMFLENLQGIRPAEPGRSIRPELEGLGTRFAAILPHFSLPRALP